MSINIFKLFQLAQERAGFDGGSPGGPSGDHDVPDPPNKSNLGDVEDENDDPDADDSNLGGDDEGSGETGEGEEGEEAEASAAGRRSTQRQDRQSQSSRDTRTTAEIEAEAAKHGWTPRAQWRGRPERWVGAKEFLARAEQMIPILQKRDAQKDQELADTREEVAELKSMLEAANEQLDTLMSWQGDSELAAQKARRKQLLRTRRDAREAGDEDQELEADEQLEELNQQISATEERRKDKTNGKEDPTGSAPKGKTPAKKQQTNVQYEKSQGFVEWLADNPQFETDGRWRALALATAEDLRKDAGNRSLKGRAFFDKVTEEVDKFLGTRSQRRPNHTSKTEGGRGAGGRSGEASDAGNDEGAEGETYADLPQDARAECDSGAAKFVGKNRRFKSVADYRKWYAKEYFSPNEVYR